ncbi:MAG: ABC transporter ATP-binding protein [Cyanobacteria bacterium P01_A01_bin.84]
MLSNRLILQFAKKYPYIVILAIVLGFSGALFNGVSLTLIVPIILKIVGQDVDLSQAPSIIKAIITPFDQVSEDYRLFVMASAIVITIALKNAGTYFSSLTSNSLRRLLARDMREAGLKLLLDIDIDYHTKMKLGDLMNRLNTEIPRAALSAINLIKLIILSITILVFLCILISVSWQLTIGSTVLLSLVALLNQYSISRSKVFGKEISNTSKAYSNAMIETLSGIRLVKSTTNEDSAFRKITKLIHNRERAEFLSQANSEAIGPTSEVAGIIALMLIVFLGKTIFADNLAALSAVILTYLLILLRTLPLISQLNAARSAFANTSSSVDVVSDFLRRDNKPFMKGGNCEYTSLQEGIHFNHISFAYPSTEKLVLKDIDIYLPRGTTLALVGGSGAGKSTMADLLPRFYDPISGCITFDGMDMREFNIKSMRQNMGIVSQDTFLLNDSVKNNISFSKPDATDEEIITAAKRANAYEFIDRLPEGFDTFIGDRGMMLSGGQRQRIAIARALLQNPEILILDEATSALDTVSERLVQEALDDLSRDRTTLIIAHRLSTVQKAHQIAVLEQGQVVEIGTHQELLEKDGAYKRLYTMQFGETKTEKQQVQQGLVQISHEIRTRLNSMIGSLLLLGDGLVEDSQEKQELLEEAHKSAWRILNTIDVFDDFVGWYRSLHISSQTDDSDRNSQHQILIAVCEELRNSLYPMLSSLRSLVDNVVEESQQQEQLITEACQTSIYLLHRLERFEDKALVNT